MKAYLALLTVLAVLSAGAQTPRALKPVTVKTDAKADVAKTNANANASAEVSKTDTSLQTSGVQAPKKSQSLMQEAKPNEILTDKVSYSGIAVQVIKTDNPLQLVNPFAPDRYGSPEDNTLRDPIDGKAIGLKIFSIRF